MKSLIHTILIYPLIFMFAYILKGKKTAYEEYFTKKEEEFKKLNILKLEYKKFDFFEKINFYFDKNKDYHDRTHIVFNTDLSISPEKKDLGIFDFSKKIDMFFSASMLSRRISNFNLLFTLKFENKLNENSLNNFTRYCLLSYASKKIDHFFIDNKSLENKDLLLIHTTLQKYLDNSSIENFSVSKDLYVLTCKNNGKKFDIIWLSSNREIELSESNKVYDKFGVLLEGDVKITQSPIYAYHK